jgi:hypothetical protein
MVFKNERAVKRNEGNHRGEVLPVFPGNSGTVKIAGKRNRPVLIFEEIFN